MSDPLLVLLADDHRLDGFDCGQEQLDVWLAKHARASHKADLARTYLALSGDRVAGYVSLTTGSVDRREVPRRFARGMPAYPLPTILIARLAVAREWQGRRLGSRLLAEALRMAVGASDAVAARLVVVDAIDEATAAFYRRWGFVDLPENPLRLHRKISDVRRSLADASADR